MGKAVILFNVLTGALNAALCIFRWSVQGHILYLNLWMALALFTYTGFLISRGAWQR